MATDEFNLTGTWKGIFNYPRKLPANSFDAELRDHSSVLTGETFEIGDGILHKGQRLHAMLQGQRHGADVNFTKLYDTLQRPPVNYSGTIGSEGDEISGIWTIPGSWSGTFIMIRAKRRAGKAELKISEPVS